MSVPQRQESQQGQRYCAHYSDVDRGRLRSIFQTTKKSLPRLDVRRWGDAFSRQAAQSR